MRANKGRAYVIQAVAGMILALALFQFIQCAYGQNINITAFTPATRFNIPQLKGSIGFAYNGTYASATLQNDTWVFTGLTLNNSNILGNLNISVQDSNITIFTFYSYRQSSQFNRYGYIRYYAEGAGVQTVNLNINVTGPTHTSEWGVVNPAGVFLAEGRDWHLMQDNTVSVYGRTGNVTVAHYGFTVDSDSNLPFYMQHSVAIATFAVLSVAVITAVLISFSIRRKPAIW